MQNTTQRPNCREQRFVRPSHGGYVGHVTVKVLSESRQWMQGSSITEYDTMAEAEAKQRRYNMITAPFDDGANDKDLARRALDSE